MKILRLFLGLALGLGVVAVRPAYGSFHVMQIEQVIGGVNGNTSAQAIQLRMRGGGQNQVQNARLIAHDAAGANPIIVCDMASPVPTSAAGSRVLIATADFASYCSVASNFTMTPIPTTYLAAGSLTFEDDFGTIYWRLSWGGAGYTGSGTGAAGTNDADGNFNPPFDLALPSTTTQALQFKNASSALSTTNASDYQITSGAATFTNNAGQSGQTVAVEAPVSTRVMLSAPAPNPSQGRLGFTVNLPREALVHVAVFDMRGRRIRSVIDSRLGAGNHHYSWNGVLPSGAYLLRLDADGVTRTRKFSFIH